MKRAKQLDTVIFSENTLFILEEFEDGSVQAEATLSAGGIHIVYESEVLTPYITLDSKTYGWVDDIQVEALVAMWKQLDTTFTLTYDDDTTEVVRMAKEKKMVFTPTHEGSCKYTALIPLAKVIL